MSLRLVIIEDEPLLAERLQNELQRADPAIEVLTILPSIREALAWFETNDPPELIFSDIQLLDGLSFEIFKRLSLQTPVIFCTAFDEYALEAFKANGIDYLLKPFTSEDIQKTLEKYQAITGPTSTAPETSPTDLYAQLDHVIQQLKGKEQTTILIHLKDRILPIRRDEIALGLVENGMTYILTLEGKRYMVNDKLDQLHQRLGDSFYRVNRQYIINREGIGSVSQFFGRKLLIEPSFTFQDKLVVSKANASHFLNWLAEH